MTGHLGNRWILVVVPIFLLTCMKNKECDLGLSEYQFWIDYHNVHYGNHSQYSPEGLGFKVKLSNETDESQILSLQSKKYSTESNIQAALLIGPDSLFLQSVSEHVRIPPFESQFESFEFRSSKKKNQKNLLRQC